MTGTNATMRPAHGVRARAAEPGPIAPPLDDPDTEDS